MDISTAQKLLRIAFGLFIFLGCLIIGYQTGSNITAAIPSEGINTPTPAPTIKHPQTLQHNILLILVDNTKSVNWNLEALILIIKVPGEYHYTFLPIYPNKKLADPSLNKKLKDAMSSSAGNSIPNTFWNLLTAHQYFWDDFILIDLKTLELFFSSIGLDHVEINPESVDESGKLGWIHNACQYIDKSNHLGDIPTEVMSGIFTNIPKNKLKDQWLDFRQAPATLQCEFPLEK